MERQYSRKGNQKYPIYSNRYTDGPHILVGEPRYNRYITEGPHQYMGEPRYRYASEGPHQYMGEPREERYASDGPHILVGEPRDDERMAAIEHQLDMLLQAQLQQLQQQQPQIQQQQPQVQQQQPQIQQQQNQIQQQQNQIQQQQNQIQQEEPHLQIEPGHVINFLPAEPEEETKSWERLMDIILQSDQQPNPLTKLDWRIRQIMTKYVDKKLEKQKADYETKIKNLEEQITKLKIPPPPPPPPAPAPEIDYASVSKRVCKEQAFLDELVRVVNNAWDNREKVDPAGIAKTLERKISRSEEARRLIFVHEDFKNKYSKDYNTSKLQQDLYNDFTSSIKKLVNDPREYQYLLSLQDNAPDVNLKNLPTITAWWVEHYLKTLLIA